MTQAIDLFAGMGGLGLAAEHAGAEVVYANEVDPHAADVHDANFEVPVDRRSITDVSADEVPAHDVMLGGFPCQSFSIAGRRGGFEDERGKMFPEMMRIAVAHRTPLIVAENVKHLVTHDKGRTMETIVRWLHEAGYGVAYQVLNSWTHAGIPQARERVYLVAALGRNVPQDIFPAPLGYLPDAATTPVWRELLEDPKDVEAKHWYAPDRPMAKLFAETLATEDRVYKYAGHDGEWGLNHSRRGLVPTLTAGSQGGKVPMILDRVYKFHRADELRAHDLVPTMMANMGTGGGKVPMVLEESDHALQPRRFTERECARLQGFPDDFKLDVVSSTQQYRMIGNAVTVSLAERVVRRALTLLG